MLIKLYNTEKKEPMGTFRGATLAARYLYKLFDQSKTSAIQSALTNKGKIYNSDFSFPVAVRPAPDKELADGQNYIIYNDYPNPAPHHMQGFTDMAPMGGATKTKAKTK